MVRETVLLLLQEICHSDQVVLDPDVDLYETGLLDSLGTVELIVGLEQRLSVDIPPSAIDRELWSTPTKIIRSLEDMVAGR